MTTIAVAPLQLAALTWALDVVREHADNPDNKQDDDYYTDADVPTVRNEPLAGRAFLDFPTDNKVVVDDLVDILERNAIDDDVPEAARSLANTIRRAHGLTVVDPPSRGPSPAELALMGAHPDLVRRGIFKGVDLATLAARFWRLEAMRSEGPLPKIRWRAPSRGSWVGGTAYVGRGRVIVRMTPGATIERAAEVLLHELVHMACPKREHHGEVFRRRLIACAREAFGIPLDTAALLALGPGKMGKRAYAIDEAIIQMMTADNVRDVKKQMFANFVRPPPVDETEEQVADRRDAAVAARVAEREAHARAMLAQWERRLAAAKTRAAKWRTKVRGYERRQLAAAAKRGGAS